MTFFPKEVFSLICDYSGSIYKRQFNHVIKVIHSLDKDWVTKYWEYQQMEGMYTWSIFHSYDNRDLSDLIHSVFIYKDMYSSYTDLLKLEEEETIDSIYEFNRVLEINKNLSIIFDKPMD